MADAEGVIDFFERHARDMRRSHLLDPTEAVSGELPASDDSSEAIVEPPQGETEPRIFTPVELGTRAAGALVVRKGYSRSAVSNLAIRQ